MSTNQNASPFRIYLKHNRFVLALGILLLGLGLWIDFYWFAHRPTFIIIVTNLLPGLSFILVWYIASQNLGKRWLIIVLGGIITLFFSLCAIFVNVAAAAFLGGTTVIDDPSRYPAILEEMGDSELIRHFPTQIPDTAANVKFVYFGGFLQGGAYIQLRLQLPRDEITKIYNEYRSIAQYKFIGGDRNTHANELYGVPTTNFYTSGTDNFTFPNTYEILVLNVQPGDDPEFEWNHGYSYGVAISTMNSEIIYWAEDW